MPKYLEQTITWRSNQCARIHYVHVLRIRFFSPQFLSIFMNTDSTDIDKMQQQFINKLTESREKYIRICGK